MDVASNEMQNTWKLLQHQLEDELESVDKDESNVRTMARRAMEIASKYLVDLSASILGYMFESGEEVYYFKVVKPYFAGRLLYYTKLLKIESERPPAGPAGIEAYYTQQLQALSTVYRDHQFIHEYLQSGQTYLDEKLFFRPEGNSLIAINGFHPPVDGSFRISYDHVVATLLANEFLKQYLLKYLSQLDLPGHEAGNLPKITWTAPKVHFVEFAYGLYASKVFNNGKAKLKDIIECLEIAMNIKSGNHSRQLQEILYRQSGYTVFHDFVKNNYVLYLNRIEDKHTG